MKTKGFTVIESVVAVTVIAIVFLLSTPIIKNMGMVDGRVKKQNQVDSEFSTVSKFIKSSIRSSRNNRDLSAYPNDPEYAGVFSKYKNNPNKLFKSKFIVDSDETGPLLFLEIPVKEDGESEFDSRFVFFYFDDVNKELKYRESKLFDEDTEDDVMDDPDSYKFNGSWTTLMENVEDASFQFRNGMVKFYIDVSVGKYEGKIKDKLRDSATSRINF